MRDTAKQVALVEEMVEEEAARISASESKLRKLAAGASALASVGAGGLGGGLGLGGVAEPQEQTDYQEVECPAGAAAGDTIEVELPAGRLLSVVVPDGVAPGEVFTVAAPALVAEDDGGGGGGGGYAGLDDAGTSSHEQSDGVGAAQSFGRLVRQVDELQKSYYELVAATSAPAPAAEKTPAAAAAAAAAAGDHGDALDALREQVRYGCH
jgi:hypothetical protein